MRHGISVTHLEGLLHYAKDEGDKYVRLERRELDLIIRELRSRRAEGKRPRFNRNRYVKQILNLAAKLRPVAKTAEGGGEARTAERA